MESDRVVDHIIVKLKLVVANGAITLGLHVLSLKHVSL